MSLSQQNSKYAHILKILLVFFFVYGGLSYSLSLMEYTWFHLSGKAVFGVEQRITQIDRDGMIAEFNRCGGPLFAASTLETEQAGDLITVRCGRFWPFYQYSLELPANPYIPGAFIKNADEPNEIQSKKADLIEQLSTINLCFFVLGTVVLGMALAAAFAFVVQKNQAKGYKRAFHSFVSSILMVVSYTGIMFFVDPMFGLGW